jgi:glutamine synthetase
LQSAIDAFSGSALADQLGNDFAKSYASISVAEVALGAEHSKEADEVNDWERNRYMDHS